MGARAGAVGDHGCAVADRLIPSLRRCLPRRVRAGRRYTGYRAWRGPYMYPSLLPAFPDYGIKGHEVSTHGALSILERVPGDTCSWWVTRVVEKGGTGRSWRPGPALAVSAGACTSPGNWWTCTSLVSWPGLDVAVNPVDRRIGLLHHGRGAAHGQRRRASGNVKLASPAPCSTARQACSVPLGDPAALAAAVTELLADPARRADMGKRGRWATACDVSISPRQLPSSTSSTSTPHPALPEPARRQSDSHAGQPGSPPSASRSAGNHHDRRRG